MFETLSSTYLHDLLVGKDEVAVVDVDHVEAAADGESLLEQVIAVLGAQRRQNTNVLKRSISVFCWTERSWPLRCFVQPLHS